MDKKSFIRFVLIVLLDAVSTVANYLKNKLIGRSNDRGSYTSGQFA